MHWARRPWVFWATASVVVLGVAASICRDPATPASATPPPVAPSAAAQTGAAQTGAAQPAAAPSAEALIDSRAATAPQPLQDGIAQEMGLGEAAAKEAALLGADDWIAEVQTHSADWRTVTVKIGPPQSEWLMAISLQWDAGARCYDVVGEQELPYP